MKKIKEILKLYCQQISVMVVLLFIASSCALSNADEPVTFFGRVTDTAGNGLADVEVGVYFTRDSAFASTDTKGNYSIKIPLAGRMDLFFRKEGFATYNKRFFLLGGHKERIDLLLKTLSEDAYFNLETHEITLYNYGGFASTLVTTNVDYEIESQPSFLQCTTTPKRIYVEGYPNYTSEERSGLVIIEAEYGLRDTLIVTQMAGPASVNKNYSQNDH